jgi:hypothetical protein
LALFVPRGVPLSLHAPAFRQTFFLPGTKLARHLTTFCYAYRVLEPVCIGSPVAFAVNVSSLFVKKSLLCGRKAARFFLDLQKNFSPIQPFCSVNTGS